MLFGMILFYERRIGLFNFLNIGTFVNPEYAVRLMIVKIGHLLILPVTEDLINEFVFVILP